MIPITPNPPKMKRRWKEFSSSPVRFHFVVAPLFRYTKSELIVVGMSLMSKHEIEILVCRNLRPGGGQPSCQNRGSLELADEIEKLLHQRSWNARLTRVVCMGKCNQGPTVKVAPGGQFYLGYNVNDASRLLDQIMEDHGGTLEDVPETEDLPPPGT